MSDAEIDENLHDSDQEISKHHLNLVDAVTRLDKRQRVKRAKRSEPSLDVSEYNLVRSKVKARDAVSVPDLIKSLERKGDQDNIVKKLLQIQQKNKVLPKPLEKPAAERIKRTFGYDKVKEDLNKWDSVVARNRTAEQLSFPLKRLTPIKDHSSRIPQFLRGFNTKSDLMKKFEQVDPTLLYPPEKEKEKDNVYKMTLEEIKERRKEAARLRAQQSYKDAKAHRQGKIKSKKFHRIQRKDKLKQQIKDFEKLKENNPQEALAKLEQLDRTRAEERMSLRHKNTGQWARNKQIKAKYDKETRQVLAEQLAISRELTQKVKRTDSDEEDEEDKEDEEDEILLKNKKNKINLESEIDDFLKSCREYYDKKRETKGKKIEGDEISDEILSEKEKKELCLEEKDDTSQADKSDIKSKLQNKKKSHTLHADMNDVKSNSCNNEENNTLQTNANNTKSKLQKEKKSKKKSSISQVSDIKDKSCSNEKDSSSLANTNDVKEQTQKKRKNKEGVKSVDATSKNNKNKNKKLKSQDACEMFDSEGSKKKKSKLNLKIQEEESEDYLPNLEFEDPKRKPILDSPLEETTSRKETQKDSDLKSSLKTIANSIVQEPADINHEVEIDPKKYVNIKPKYLKTQLPDVTTGGDEDSEQEEETHKIMSEAFADDDVVEEFRKEKEEEMKNSQPQEIDLSLPGWGTWGGPNIKKNKLARKKRRIILNVPKVAPRKPENQGRVIVFEHENEKLKKHLVKELPYPFTRIKDFEAIIRAPVSRTFVPMNAHLRLIQPAVKTKLGQVIEPMDENELVKKQPVVKKPLKRITAKTAKAKKTKDTTKTKNEKQNIRKNNNKKKRKKSVQNV